MQVQEFNKLIAGDDSFARTNLFTVEIFPPRGQTSGHFAKFYNDGDKEGTAFLSYKAKQVSIPGKSIGTIDAKRFGPIYKVANDLIVDTVAMTFMCSEGWKEHKFFDGWISGIMGQGKNTMRQIYTLNYYEDYISQVNIIPLDRQGGAAANIVLVEAYPTNVGPVELSWGDQGEVATFTVTWSFRDWNHTGTDGWWADHEEGKGPLSTTDATFRKDKVDQVTRDNSEVGGALSLLNIEERRKLAKRAAEVLAAVSNSSYVDYSIDGPLGPPGNANVVVGGPSKGPPK